MNLTQIKAKETFLAKQQEEMIALYKQVGKSEREAILRQIDSFLSVVSQDEKIFWLKFRSKLVALNEKSKVLFPLGQTVMTQGAKQAIEDSNQLPMEFLAKHQSGDFGIIGKEDWKENELSIKEGFRILSAYKTTFGAKIWIITEANREVTTLLLPEEY